MVPLPFVGDEDTEYVAFTATPKFGPLGEPVSSVPVMVPVGLAPFAVNSPEKIVTPSVIGAVAKPVYAPLIVLSERAVAVCGSPNPNNTELSGTTKKA